MAQQGPISSAVSSDSLEIPLIDFNSFLTGDASTKNLIAQAILSGFQNAGFVYLTNHPIPKATVEATFQESATFFRRPRAQKDSLAWTTPEANRGYSKPGLEKTTSLTDREEIAKVREEAGEDLKESFEIGREDDGFGNSWPPGEEGEAFKGQMLTFFELCKGVHMQVMRAIALGMGLEEGWFDGFTDRGDCTLRLLHYPQVKAEVFQANVKQVRAGAHSDYGSITLLFQDSSGGLEVMSPNNNFIPATPIADTIVVNAGDLLARWSNDTIKSTVHRVVQPPTPADTHPSRYSIAYFCNPNFDRFIDAIPGTYDEVKGKKYEGVNSGEYLVQRLTATY